MVGIVEDEDEVGSTGKKRKKNVKKIKKSIVSFIAGRHARTGRAAVEEVTHQTGRE